VHESPTSRHLRAFKTWRKIEKQFYWPGLKDDVFQCVKQCKMCQAAKPAQDVNRGFHVRRDHVTRRYDVGRKGTSYKQGGLTEVNSASDEEERTKFWTQAIRNLNVSRDRVARRFNVGRQEGKFKVGDTVVYQRNVLSTKGKGVSQKLELKWSKPVVIVKVLGPNTVLLAVPETGVIIRKAHVSQLKRYYKDNVK